MPRTPQDQPDIEAPEGAKTSAETDDRPDERAGETGAPWEPGRSPAGNASATDVVPPGGYPSASPARATPEEEAARGATKVGGGVSPIEQQPLPGNRKLPE